MSKKQAKQQAPQVVSQLTLAQARALLTDATSTGDRVQIADAVDLIIHSGTGYHAVRASEQVRLADKVVVAGDVWRVAANAVGEALPDETPGKHFVRVGLGAWKFASPGMVRCLGSWKPSDRPSTF